MTFFGDQIEILVCVVCNTEGEFSFDEVYQLVDHISLISTNVFMYQLSQHLDVFQPKGVFRTLSNI